MKSPDEATFRHATKAIVAGFAFRNDNTADADLDRLAHQIAVLALIAVSTVPLAAKSEPQAAPR